MTGECDSCHYSTTLAKYPVGPHAPGDERWLCALCASTTTSLAVGNPGELRGHEDAYKVMQTVCYVGNVILDAIAAAAPPKRSR